MTKAEQNMVEEMAYLFNMDMDEVAQQMYDAGCLTNLERSK